MRRGALPDRSGRPAVWPPPGATSGPGPVPGIDRTSSPTDAQAAFLLGLSREERESLRGRPGLRGLLDWFRNGPDRILSREAYRLLRRTPEAAR